MFHVKHSRNTNKERKQQKMDKLEKMIKKTNSKLQDLEFRVDMILVISLINSFITISLLLHLIRVLF